MGGKGRKGNSQAKQPEQERQVRASWHSGGSIQKITGIKEPDQVKILPLPDQKQVFSNQGRQQGCQKSGTLKTLQLCLLKQSPGKGVAFLFSLLLLASICVLVTLCFHFAAFLTAAGLVR
jgi:hypothetical protein